MPAQQWVRITEVLPDPVQPGKDAEYEWVELTNLGPGAVDTAGMSLRDGQASTPLPALTIPPGASVVIAGPLAEVDADARVAGTIGNGLGNDGDRLQLLDASGQSVDAFAFGEGTPLLPAPGESIHRWFEVGAAFIAAAVGAPSPGVHEPPSELSGTGADAGASDSAGEEGAEVEREADAGGPDGLAWVLLLAVGGGALGGAAVQRVARGGTRESR
ncbi:MAG: lamin tail domain-containing protein [Dehalococcoidia bacterium]